MHTPATLGIPIMSGMAEFGAWQATYRVEHRGRARARKIVLHEDRALAFDNHTLIENEIAIWMLRRPPAFPKSTQCRGQRQWTMAQDNIGMPLRNGIVSYGSCEACTFAE